MEAPFGLQPSFRWLVAVTFQPGNPGQVDAEKETYSVGAWQKKILMCIQ